MPGVPASLMTTTVCPLADLRDDPDHTTTLRCVRAVRASRPLTAILWALKSVLERPRVLAVDDVGALKQFKSAVARCRRDSRAASRRGRVDQR